MSLFDQLIALLSTIIIVMLSRIFCLLKPGFARSYKPKKTIAPPISSPEEDNNNLTNQQMPINEFNTKLKEQDRKLKEKVQKLVNQNMKQQEILKKFIGEQKAKSQTPEDLDLIRQEMMLNEISQKYSKKKKQSQLPIGSKYEENDLGESEKEEKKNRILSKLREQTSETKQIEEIGFQERLKQKYSENSIEEAEKLKNHEMKYFNELMSNNYIKQHQGTVNPLNRRLNKGETYAEARQRDKTERKQASRQRKEKSQIVKQYEKLQIQYKEEKAPKSQELVEYEDENYYKEKGIKQFQVRQLKKNVDKELIEAGEKDLEESRETYDIIMEQYDEVKYDNDYKKMLYRTSSFGKIDAKMNDLQNRLSKQGIQLEIDDFKSMKKDLLFNQKKDREEELRFQKYLMKKQKKNETKEYFNKIHKERLREDLDYENDYKSRFKDVRYDPLDVEGNLQRLKQQNLERKSVMLNKDPKQEHHFKKTEKNMGNFIKACFYESLITPNQTVYNKIDVTSLRYNEKKTVVNVFWRFQGSEVEVNPEQINKMSKNLKSSTGFISGKMTQYLGLRYGPDIRFHYDSITQQTKEIKAALEQAKDQVIQYELRQLKEKGHIKTEPEITQTRKKLKGIAEENIRNYHNRDILLSKKYIKAQKKSKNTPNPKQKSADVRFWEHVDKL